MSGCVRWLCSFVLLSVAFGARADVITDWADTTTEIADEGPGMFAEELERVFERFYRADGSRSRASGGVGLGLSIVAAVAEAHGGSVEARSDTESGAAFRIVLPLAADEPDRA